MSTLSELATAARRLPEQLLLKGKKVLIVGGNKGLGQAMSLAFAAVGADVFIAARGPDGLRETAEAARAMGVGGGFLAVDVTSEAEVIRLMDAAVEQMGGLDVLVNSQGAVYLEDSTAFDMEQWRRIMDINIMSLVLTCKHAGRIMVSRGRGKIINISSVRGFQGRIGDMAYAPSKGAVNQLTRSLAIEWGPKGVNVNAIAPSFIRTAISAPFLDDPEKRKWILSRSPMGKVGELTDMFGPAVFLASDASGFVNGHVLMVDGGWTIA